MRYCKSTIFQANHNIKKNEEKFSMVVCDTAKVRFFKQITTKFSRSYKGIKLFAILQKYDFSSKSQLISSTELRSFGCLRYCKSTIFQANHNSRQRMAHAHQVVCDTAKVRFFKQITTRGNDGQHNGWLFAILQKYDFSSKSQQQVADNRAVRSCLRYCKSTIFQANHNPLPGSIGTDALFAILQKYDFSSKSQHN